MSDSLKRETYSEYTEQFFKEKDDIENQEMWIELALLAEKGLPYPKTKGADKEKKQMALERAILLTEQMMKGKSEKLSKSNCTDEESGQLE